MGMLEDLIAQLDALDGREVTVGVTDISGKQPDVAELAERIARELSKPGGPQIAQRAIANR